MADDVENDDQWLYGESNDGLTIGNQHSQGNNATNQEQPPQTGESQEDENVNTDIDQPDNVEIQANQNEDVQNTPPEDGEIEKQAGECSDKEDFDEDSDDDVNVVIGDIKTSSSYTTLNIKRGGLLTTANATDKTKQVQQPGKFAVEEFDQVGTINGVPATEYNLDSLEEKPWRKPGADITDYFNYGFNEDTWRAYCERQKRF
ncbi:hypothetical protein AMK59_4387 [Oryctes borbonicus]|uniref:Pre-mRNA polyadenylation factor Fip1 domain-containing protein n=1 Tax=Oryctes borbonicus TaxID=1629725 RepID=A0A0T6B5H0_9SCAR|nr:hypothetical protein AMK59_4387 [Oryctes borbonicus]